MHSDLTQVPMQTVSKSSCLVYLSVSLVTFPLSIRTRVSQLGQVFLSYVQSSVLLPLQVLWLARQATISSSSVTSFCTHTLFVKHNCACDKCALKARHLLSALLCEGRWAPCKACIFLPNSSSLWRGRETDCYGYFPFCQK